MMKLFISFYCAFQLVSSLEVTPEKLEMETWKNKYFENILFTFRRRSRTSPYYIDFDFNAKTGYGNNLTIKWTLYEHLSGHYVQIPILFEYKLCDFLYKDPYFGQTYAKQFSLRGNWSCPFPAGKSVFTNLVMHLENLHYIPFTYTSLIVRVRVDLDLFMNHEEIAVVKLYHKLTQKLKKPKKT